MRAENRDMWARAQAVYDHFKLAWAFWAGFALFFTWAMLNVVRPLQAVAPLQRTVAKNDTTMRANFDTLKHRMDIGDQDRHEMAQVLKVFGKFICRKMTPEERYDYDIDCRQLPAPQIKPPGGP